MNDREFIIYIRQYFIQLKDQFKSKDQDFEGIINVALEDIDGQLDELKL